MTDLMLERCTSCGKTQAVARGFCPACGGPAVEAIAPAGTGTVYAITTVHRAPTAELQAEVPYAIALVDLTEGVRIMARAPLGLATGAPVRLAERDTRGALVVVPA